MLNPGSKPAQRQRRVHNEVEAGVAPKPVAWWKRSASWPLKIVTAAGVAIAAVAGGLGLLFQVEPSWEPCLGGSSASFTAAPVFPNVTYSHFLQYNVGATPASVEAVPNRGVRGAEVRFLYTAKSLRGDPLWLYATLVTVSPDGSVTGIDPTLDEFYEFKIVPNACTESGGYDVFVQPIPNTRQHYRIVLELYRGERLKAENVFQPRLALTETPVFQG